MTKGLLDQAATILGTKTKKATVNEALRRVVQAELQRRHVDELAEGALPDLADPSVIITGQPTQWVVPRGTADSGR